MKRPVLYRTPRNPAGVAPAPPARRLVYLLMCVVLVAAAVLMVGRYLAQSPPPPAPPGALGAVPAAMTRPADNAVGATPAASSPLDPRSMEGRSRFGMKASPPVSIRASNVGITSKLVQVGLNPDGTIEVPTTYSEAAWYRLGPTPGELGAAVIVGHVDSFKGPGVFFNVGDMRPGQVIDVTRADKSVAHFRIDAVHTYAKDLFPTEDVYGPIGYAGLRLVTCGGAFDEKTRSYASNVVVFASLISP